MRSQTKITLHLVKCLRSKGLSSQKPGELAIKALTDLVQNHHSQKPSVIMERFKFHSHFCKSGDSILKFVSKLRQLSEHGEFDAALEDMLRGGSNALVYRSNGNLTWYGEDIKKKTSGSAQSDFM